MPPVGGIRAPGWPTEKPETVAQAVPFDGDQARRPGPGPGGSQGSPSIGSLDDPEAAGPVLQYSFEHTLSWFPTITTLPGRRTEEFITPDLAVRFVGYQHPDHDA
jgi:hypothetical protein